MSSEGVTVKLIVVVSSTATCSAGRPGSSTVGLLFENASEMTEGS